MGILHPPGTASNAFALAGSFGADYFFKSLSTFAKKNSQYKSRILTSAKMFFRIFFKFAKNHFLQTCLILLTNTGYFGGWGVGGI
jgi:hypothetical protein